MESNTLPFTFIVLNLVFFCFQISLAVDSITRSQTVTDGRTLVSKDGSFELGFFSPGSSKSRYLGIWYKKIPDTAVVWVANRVNPINDSSGILAINGRGNVLLLDSSKTVVWSTNSSKQPQNPVLQLLDSGNLVLRDDGKDGNSDNYLWQSFDYPSDTLLPDMKVGWDSKSGLNRRLTSWKSSDDPSPGHLVWGLALTNYPEGVLWRGSQIYYRTGPSNGVGVSGSPDLKTNPVFDFKLVDNDNEHYFIYTLKNNSVISRVILNQSHDVFQREIWIEAEETWKVYATSPTDYCDDYGLCGAYGNCIINENPVCQCLKGFKPKSQEKYWKLMDWSQGCVRSQPLSCHDKHNHGFVRFVGLKLPDTTHTWLNESMNLKECRAKCLDNCSCMAYANSDIRGGGSGCAIWFGDLIDIREFPESGQDLYIRMAASDLLEMKDDTEKIKIAAISVGSVIIISAMILASKYIRRSRTKLKEEMEKSRRIGLNDQGQEEDMDIQFFDLSTITKATDNFSIDNKLGEGGFGPVYRGLLVDGQEIAVKRLSRSSGQGVNEFKNEVLLIAKLQHRNLVKLLGCCIQGEEKMLVYEYMPNKSLDFFIFDQTKGQLLDWPKRFHIIGGIARGLLYLHEDSRLRIIHRDLKASNVLLDGEMNPKISDFGMARTCGGNQTQGNTNIIVGTYGYMAPEYAFDGLFSTKSDVFSFGIILLEIVSGKRNRGLSNQDHNLNLVGYAWKLWKEGRPLELMDACLGDSHSQPSEVLRCIHVSLLSVQQRPEDRPSMSSIVLMLGSESSLPQPKEPGFFMEKDTNEPYSFSSKHESSTTNEISITKLEAR